MGGLQPAELQTEVTNFQVTHGENITFHALLPIHRKILLKLGGLFIQFKQMMIKYFTCFEKNLEFCCLLAHHPFCGRLVYCVFYEWVEVREKA